MPITVYNCDLYSGVKEIKRTKEESPFVFSQYFIVGKYEHLYEKNKKHFDSANTPYALPGKGKAVKPYYGFDREPLTYTPDGAEQFSFKDIARVFRSLPEKENCEIIYVRIVDSDTPKPDGMTFLGYDVCYPPDSDGFSAICDCMFLCRWHGCDEDGTEFRKEFGMLNKNGLFDRKDNAVQYLYHYQSQDWSETGEFCIVEIYR